MQSGPFIKLISSTYRVDEKTVAVYARALKEAGLLTSGARGVNAPNMLPLDAARLTLALIATDKPSEAVELVLRYGAMKIRQTEATGDLSGKLFAEDPTLEHVLVRAFAYDPETDAGESPYVEVRRNDKSAAIELLKTKAVFRDANIQNMSLTDRQARAGIWRISGVIPTDLMKILVTLWADRFRGCDEMGLPLDLNHSWNKELRGEEYQNRVKEVTAYIRQRDADWMKGATIG